MLSILTLLIFPTLGICLLLFLNFVPQPSSCLFNYFSWVPWIFKKNDQNNIFKGLAFYFTFINFFFSFYFYYFFDLKLYGFQFSAEFINFNLLFRFGLDGISLCFILLTTFLIPLCVLISWDYVTKDIFSYLIAFLFLEIFLILFFSTLNILFFYISFESILIPMFLIIGMWGGPRKVKANYYFFIFTLVGSVFMLLALLFIWKQTDTLDFVNLLRFRFTTRLECFLWLFFFLGFTVKIPIFPFHLWLPEAHVEAPTAGSVILAGLLLKLGGYGFIRVCLTLFPYANYYFSTYLSLFCILSVIFASFVAIIQIDLKKLVAYSSIAHMNFGLLGLFTGTKLGLDGCIISMLSHGFVSSALFICVDVLYRRFGTRLLDYYAGLVFVMPNYTFFLFFFCLSNLGFPGTSSFIGEFLVLSSLISWSSFLTVVAGTTVIWGSVYSLFMFTRVSFGNYKAVAYLYNVPSDLNKIEFTVVFILALVSLILGLYPVPILDIINYSTNFIIENRKI